MKKLILLSVALVVLSFGAMSASAQTRITFMRGATSKVVTGTLSGYKSHRTFVIHVRKGQTLETENAGNKLITVSIKAPPGSTYEQDMAADCHDRNEVNPTAAGDYRITVTECLKGDRWRGTFKFRVSVK